MFKSLLYEVFFCKQWSQILTKEKRVTTWESGTGFIGHLSNKLPPSQLLLQGTHDLLPTAKFPFHPGIRCHPRILACGPLSFLQDRNCFLARFLTELHHVSLHWSLLFMMWIYPVNLILTFLRSSPFWMEPLTMRLLCHSEVIFPPGSSICQELSFQ